MPDSIRDLSRPAGRRRTALLAGAGLFAALLVACGGGGGGETNAPAAAPGTAGASSFAAGPISGFGSVIVNGVRFEDSSAHVSDDDGVAHDRSELKLGMTVQIAGGPTTSDASGMHGTAGTIAFRSEIVGPVSAVDTTAQTLTVIGQPVDVSPATVFDASLVNGLASVTAGSVVEVYGTLDPATGHFAASRIEPKPAAASFKLRGLVAGLDPAAHTFTIGGALVSYAGLAANQVPATLANGLLVRVRLRTVPVAGAWVATELKSALQRVEDHDEAHVRGTITAFTSATQFSVDGIAVDATQAAFPDGTAGVVLGARVAVEGKASAGMIVATRVSVISAEVAHRGQFELHGLLAALDTTAKTFVLRGLTVNYGGAGVVFKDGTASDLAAGRQVEVKGALSADGTQVVAASVDFDR